MAQEIMVAGAIYEDVPSVRLPDSNGVFHPFTDTSDTTAVAADVAQGKTFHLADGSAATGTAAGATLVTKTVTANGTYSAEDDDADGYSEVTVNVSGGGGGGGGVEPKDVNFIDYDGTIVHSYTAAEFATLTAMPDNPTHEGLVSQGWNWTLADAKESVADTGMLVIGQMYVTESGDTEIDIELYEGRLSPCLGISVNGTVTIDWGDGSATNTVTGTSLTTQKITRHNYAEAGSYTISVHVVSGTLGFYATNNIQLLSNNKTNASQNRVYSYSVKAVRVGNNAWLGEKAFYNCGNMETVTLPSYIRLLSTQTFYACKALRSVTIPVGITSIYKSQAFESCGLASVSLPKVSSLADSTFKQCSSLTLVSIPKGVTTMPQDIFNGCSNLKRIEFPSTVSSIATYVVASCYSLESITIPSAVTTIGSSAFSGDTRLSKITIPDKVTSIGTYGLSNCYGLGEIHFLGTTPPTVTNSNAFNNISTDCKIYVPQGSLSDYTSAANYPSSSTYTYVEE